MGKENSGLGKPYRLSLVEDESHKHIRSWRFTRLGGIVGAVTAIVVSFLLLFALIALTPIKSWVPGYPDAHFKRDAIANAIKIDSLENEMFRWSLYAENLSRVLAGEEGLVADSLIAAGTRRYLSELSERELARRDSLLRIEVQNAQQVPSQDGSGRVLPIEGMHFFSPVKGTVTAGFDKVAHPSVEVSAPANSVVCAVLDGTVVFSGWTDDGGYAICIQHPGNIISCYRHGQKVLKNTADKVTAGTPVALVGENLLLEIWYNGEAVDPSKYCTF